MYITVKYGQNESLLCNPSCAVVNLMSNIKRRAGYGNSDVQLDLSDETGLVKELDIHKYEYATKFLTTHTTYILVEKQSLAPEEQEAGTDSSSNPSTPTPPQVQYIPLLDDDTCRDQFPNFKLHVRHVEKKRKTRTMSKSPSPAGRKVKKSTAHARSSSRKK